VFEPRYRITRGFTCVGSELQCAVDPNAQPDLSKLEESVVDVDA
jgi:hypothetical protein